MTSRCSTWRKTGETVPNETTGSDEPEWAVVHVDLPCRFPPRRGGSAPSRTVEVADADLTLGLREWHVPYFSEGFEDGDLVLVTVGRSVGAVWRLVDASPPADDATAYRMDVVGERRPEEWA